VSKEDAQFAQDAIKILENATDQPYKGTRREILEVCLQDAFMLIRKNKLYGDSALIGVEAHEDLLPWGSLAEHPHRVMSRVAQSGLHGGDDGEDTAADIRGYLVLEEIAHRRSKET
jgi:hypothetical protein